MKFDEDSNKMRIKFETRFCKIQVWFHLNFIENSMELYQKFCKMLSKNQTSEIPVKFYGLSEISLEN